MEKSQKKLILEYLWLDAKQELRGKTKVLTWTSTLCEPSLKPKDLPEWNYDGSSTGQATTETSEVIIRPKKIYRDPFRQHLNNSNCQAYLVLCDTYQIDGQPHPSNTRFQAEQLLESEPSLGLQPMFGFEQEFFIINTSTGRPLGFPEQAIYLPQHQEKYYCGVGASQAIGRPFLEKILENCLEANLSITGLNLEVAPGQGEFQVCAIGMEAADQLIMLRYIINRTLEEYGLRMELEPKLSNITHDWNGSGCHTNFSTKEIRDPKLGHESIQNFLDKLAQTHKEHLQVYGLNNDQRLTGKNETSSMDRFTYGVGNRAASIRIPYETDQRGYGYIEDRRPAGNMDPYLVVHRMMTTYLMENVFENLN